MFGRFVHKISILGTILCLIWLLLAWFLEYEVETKHYLMLLIFYAGWMFQPKIEAAQMNAVESASGEDELIEFVEEGQEIDPRQDGQSINLDEPEEISVVKRKNFKD